MNSQADMSGFVHFTCMVREKQEFENMTGNTMDRRVLRTRALLQKALIALILKMDYEAITIQNIVDEADIGRSTFYAHYTNKEELLRSGFERLHAQLAEIQKEALARRGENRERVLGFSLAMFEHTEEHRDIYLALVGGRGGTVILNRVRSVLTDLVRDDLAATLGKEAADGMPRDVVVQYIVGAFISVLTWWHDRKVKLSPKQVDAIFRRLALEGIMSSNC